MSIDLPIESLTLRRRIADFLREQSLVRADKCPCNCSHPKDAGFVDATGCTEEEARRALHKKLLDLAKKIREDLKQPCVGTCDGGGTCKLIVHVLDKEKLSVDPMDDDSCPKGVGYYASYDGRISAECVCVPPKIV